MIAETNTATAVEERPEAHLFVGNLSYQLRETELKEFIEKNAGETSDVHIVFRGPRSMGYGFVTFKDAATAPKAVDALKEKELDGRRINVQICTPRSERPPRDSSRPVRGRRGERRPRGPPSETMLYVGNLPFTMTSEDLVNMFSDYQTTSCYVVTRKDGNSKGFGFVHAANNAEQLRILAEMKDATCDGRVLNLRAATSEGPFGTEEGAAEAAAEEN